MQRLAQLLKNLFAQPSQQSLNTTGAEMTLHDVLRICAARVPHPRPVVAQAGYRLTVNCCLEVSDQPLLDFRSHAFGGRLVAYGTENRAARLALIKRQTP